jgi:hypothetical protein
MVLSWSNTTWAAYSDDIREVDAYWRGIQHAGGGLKEFETFGRGLKRLQGHRINQRGHKSERQRPKVDLEGDRE